MLVSGVCCVSRHAVFAPVGDLGGHPRDERTRWRWAPHSTAGDGSPGLSRDSSRLIKSPERRTHIRACCADRQGATHAVPAAVPALLTDVAGGRI